MRSLVLRPVLVLALALATLIPAGAASAHTSLVGTDPQDGAEIAELSQVSLEFSGAVLDLGTTLALVQGDERVELEPTFPAETTVAADVPDLAAGDWSLMYRVVAEDGHPLEGQIDFTLLGDDGAAPSATAAKSAESTPTAVLTADAGASASPEPSPTDQVGEVPRDGTGGWVRFAGAAVLIVVAGGVIVWLRRRGDVDGSEPGAE